MSIIQFTLRFTKHMLLGSFLHSISSFQGYCHNDLMDFNPAAHSCQNFSVFSTEMKDIIFEIMTFLPREDLQNCRLTCKNWADSGTYEFYNNRLLAPKTQEDFTKIIDKGSKKILLNFHYSFIKTHPNLKSITVLKLTNLNLETFPKTLGKLNELTLQDCRITSDVLQGQTNTLKKLGLIRCNFIFSNKEDLFNLVQKSKDLNTFTFVQSERRLTGEKYDSITYFFNNLEFLCQKNLTSIEFRSFNSFYKLNLLKKDALSNNIVSFLKKNPNLTEVALDAVLTKEGFLNFVKDHENLKSLFISDTELYQDNLKNLKKLMSLKHLTLENTQLYRKNTSWKMPKLGNLMELNLTNSSVKLKPAPKSIIKILKKLPSLKKLNLSGNNLGETAYEVFSDPELKGLFGGLTHLNLSANNINGDFFSLRDIFTSLHYLNLSGGHSVRSQNKKISDFEKFWGLIKSIPTLRSLEVQYLTLFGINNLALELFPTQLESINFNYTDLTYDNVHRLVECCENLKNLSVFTYKTRKKFIEFGNLKDRDDFLNNLKKAKIEEGKKRKRKELKYKEEPSLKIVKTDEEDLSNDNPALPAFNVATSSSQSLQSSPQDIYKEIIQNLDFFSPSSPTFWDILKDN